MGSPQALIWSKETVRVGHQVVMKEKSQAAVIEPQFEKNISQFPFHALLLSFEVREFKHV